VSDTPATAEWVEVYRGLRRQAQVVMRYLKDGGISSRDARREPGVKAKPNEFVVQVPVVQAELAAFTLGKMKKAFPEVFSLGKAAKD